MVKHIFSCAYRSSGNGIIERNHRTIKRMAARSGRTVEEMVFWYNISPNVDGVVPMEEVFAYETRLPGRVKESEQCSDSHNGGYKVGDDVYVKPPNAKCDTKWQLGRVTGLVSDVAVEVNGTNRHIADVRLAGRGDGEESEADDMIETIGVEAVTDEEGDSGDMDEVETIDEVETTADEEGDVGNPDEVEIRTRREKRPPKWMDDYYVGYN